MALCMSVAAIPNCERQLVFFFQLSRGSVVGLGLGCELHTFASVCLSPGSEHLVALLSPRCSRCVAPHILRTSYRKMLAPSLGL